MKAQAIIPTAGSGTRFQSSVPKPLVLLKGKPIIVHTLQAFERSLSVSSVIVVVPKDLITQYNQYVKRFRLKKVARVVAGGKSRGESVYNGLQCVDKATDIVVVHDGVRPLVETHMIDEAVKQCRKQDAVVVAVPVKPTIKQVDPKSLYVKATLDRTTLWEIQTPQVFKANTLKRAYANANREATDDAALVEALGVKVKILKGDYRNIKITTTEDLSVAETFLKK